MKRVISRSPNGDAAIRIFSTVNSTGCFSAWADRIDRFNLILMLLITFLLSNPTYAQDDTTTTPVDIDLIEFKVEVKPDTAAVGDEFEVKIEVTYPDSIELTKPEVTSSIDVIAKDEPEIKTKSRRGKKIDTYKYTLAVFETGEVELPIFEFFYYDTESNQHSRIAPIETIYIKSVLPADAQNDSSLIALQERDIVPLKELPMLWWPYAVGLGVLLLLAAAYWYFFRYRIKQMSIPEEPPEPPFDVAIRRLHDLEKRDPASKGKFKLFYVELTEILRHYIDGRFKIPAAESTTFELKRILKHPQITREQTKTILKMLTRADGIKFAKQEPSSEEPLKDFTMVKDFVVNTKPVDIAEDQKEEEKPEAVS